MCSTIAKVIFIGFINTIIGLLLHLFALFSRLFISDVLQTMSHQIFLSFHPNDSVSIVAPDCSSRQGNAYLNYTVFYECSCQDPRIEIKQSLVAFRNLLQLVAFTKISRPPHLSIHQPLPSTACLPAPSFPFQNSSYVLGLLETTTATCLMSHQRP